MNSFFKILILLVFTSGNLLAQDFEISTNSSLNVRTGAGSNYKVIGSLYNGDKVYVIDYQGEWAKITYKGTEAYVSKKFLVPVKTSVAVNNSSTRETSFIRSIFEKFDGWGFWGGLILYFIIPFLLVVVCVVIPASLISSIRALHNWVYMLIAYPCAFFIMMPVGSWLLSQPGYDGVFASIWTVFILASGSFCTVRGIVRDRCPNCHVSKFAIIQTDETTRSWTEVEVRGDGYGNISSTSTRKSETDVQHLKECNECGYQWWTR